MLLTDEQRKAAWAEIMRSMSRTRTHCPLSKSEGREMFNAIDQWVEDSTASFVAAIPEPQRSATDARFKLMMFEAILRQRWEVS